MTLDPQHWPSALDMLHLILAGVSLLLLAILLIVTTRRAGHKEARSHDSVAMAESAAAQKTDNEPAAFHSLSNESALQLLSLLQQNARLIDFFRQDLEGHDDADIGAAARIVHSGGRKTLDDYFAIEPVRTEEEESRVTLEEGYDAAAVRLSGQISGSAPYTGTLVHRGWKVVDVRLPAVADGHNSRILAPAEVEL